VVLCFLGASGILFTMAYAGLVSIPLKNLFLGNKLSSGHKNLRVILLTVLIGFFIHSLTYDSLKYPHLNWIFRSLLGILVNLIVFNQNKPEID